MQWCHTMRLYRASGRAGSVTTTVSRSVERQIGWRSGLADAGRMASSGAARMRSSSNGWTAHPNLQRRPHAPAAGRGRLQVQIRLAFVGHRLLSSSQVYDSAPNNRRSLYRIAHLAFVTVYLVGRIAPLVGKLGVHAYHARIARCPCFLLAFPAPSHTPHWVSQGIY